MTLNSIKPTKYWTFDLDGTLVDSFAHYFDLLNEIFSENGARFESHLRLPALTEPIPQFLEKHLGKKAVPSSFLKLQNRSNVDAQSIQPFAEIEAILEALSSQECGTAIWTSRDLVSAELILKHSGLDRFFSLCVSGTCTSRRKPDPEGLIKILNHFGCRPNEMTMVGDHEHDVQAARKAGTNAIRASWHNYWHVEACSDSHHHFREISEFKRWISSDSQRSAAPFTNRD